ncbi:lipoyl(octanoyl) transferase LipB [Alteromonas sediminis]|uniref:Octanoyltransferase n=2 Tax=Alteromonas sediminis TaxID=2259342 RepID=A0A3N5Y3V4_9ALTE|nr:lipoyl(octanoyl) transferase LipB [Alteromonas sediminis]RPJ68777.1 lipoyl(octanoyl) transferase LipB [Alteromonas sediminis]
MVIVRQLGKQAYQPVWQAMQSFTDNRTPETTDEMWLVEHDPVFTQGQAGKDEHVLMPGDIPVVKVDRGGQVTYHGPGQQVLYVLLDIKRAKLGVRQLVNALERSVVNIMAEYDVEAYPRSDAPGVYVDGSKLCSVGLRIRKGCSFHGLAMNVNMDLGPFQRINPCGYAGMEMVNASDLGGPATVAEAGKGLVHYLVKELNIDTVINKEGFDE